MKVKLGYKQTEVGVIPEPWEVLTLSDVLRSFQNGFAFSSQSYVKSGIPIVTMAQIGLDGSFQYDSEKVNYWAVDALSKLTPFQLFRGDVIIAMTDVTPQKNLIGRMAEVTEVGPLLLNQRVGLLRLDPEKIDSYYLRAVSNSKMWRDYARSVASLGVQANISTKQIKAGKLAVPSIAEQRRIRQALSDVDELLGGLDRLIAKKRALKQAAMQQLLAGQTRLPDFHGKWEAKRLGDVLKVRHGKSQREVAVADGTFPILASGGEIGRTNSYLYDKPSVLIGRKGTIDAPQFIATPFWTVDTLFFTEISANADPKFMFYKFTTIPWRSYNEASGVPSLNAKTIENIGLTLPLTSEQTAIAEVLSDMDGELAVLEQRRDKTRALKQGMMQELLTGRTRLV